MSTSSSNNIIALPRTESESTDFTESEAADVYAVAEACADDASLLVSAGSSSKPRSSPMLYGGLAGGFLLLLYTLITGLCVRLHNGGGSSDAKYGTLPECVCAWNPVVGMLIAKRGKGGEEMGSFQQSDHSDTPQQISDDDAGQIQDQPDHTTSQDRQRPDENAGSVSEKQVPAPEEQAIEPKESPIKIQDVPIATKSPKIEPEVQDVPIAPKSPKIVSPKPVIEVEPELTPEIQDVPVTPKMASAELGHDELVELEVPVEDKHEVPLAPERVDTEIVISEAPSEFPAEHTSADKEDSADDVPKIHIPAEQETSDLGMPVEEPPAFFSPSISRDNSRHDDDTELSPSVETPHHHRPARGLYNEGNSCWLNSLLQCLVALPPLARPLADLHASGRLTNVAPDNKYVRTLRALTEVVHNLVTVTPGGSDVVSAAPLYHALYTGCSGFEEGQQEDASEGWMCLVDHVNEAFKFLGDDSDVGPKLLPLFHQVRVNHANRPEYAENLTLQVPMYDDADGVPKRGPLAIQRALEAEYRGNFHVLPRVLVVHAYRFLYAGEAEKIDTPINFASEMDLGGLLVGAGRGAPAPPSVSTEYELFSVSQHLGGTGGGHYTAQAKVGSQWHAFDDTSAGPIEDPSNRDDQDAYMLFYVRKDALQEDFELAEVQSGVQQGGAWRRRGTM